MSEMKSKTRFVFSASTRKADPLAKIRQLDKANVECARIIQANPDAYGSTGLMAEWARQVLSETAGLPKSDKPDKQLCLDWGQAA